MNRDELIKTIQQNEKSLGKFNSEVTVKNGRIKIRRSIAEVSDDEADIILRILNGEL